MNRLVLLTALAVAALATHGCDVVDAGPAVASATADSVRAGWPDDRIPGEFIVFLDEGVAIGAVLPVAVDRLGGEVMYVYRERPVGFAVSGLSDAAADTLAALPGVDAVHANAPVYLLSAGGQAWPGWGLDRIDQRTGLDDAYNYPYSGQDGVTGQGVNVYVLDTGVRTSHVEFEGRASVAFDAFPSEGYDGQDSHGHGTHVAGIIASKTYGVAKDANILSVRIADTSAYGSAASIIAGLDWVMYGHQDPAVVNMSVRRPAHEGLDAKVREVIFVGIPVVVAAGNDNLDASRFSPARVAEAITVGATDATDTRAQFGVGGSNHGSLIDLFAPGKDIRSLWRTSDTATRVESGTSMAAPFVAGAVALLHERSLDLYGVPVSPVNARDELVAMATQNAVGDAKSPNAHLLFNGVPTGDLPTADFTYTSSGRTATFTDASTDPGAGLTARAWDFAGFGQSTQTHPTFTFPVSGTHFQVSLAVTDAQGYVGTVTKPVSATDGGTTF